MNGNLLILAVLIWAVTYPWRAAPLLLPAVERLPEQVLTYLRLVGPAVLTSLAAVTVLVAVGDDGVARLHLGLTAAGVALCVALVAWRRNVLLGLLAAVSLVALARAGLN